MFGRLLATIIGLLVVVLSGTFVTLINPVVGIPFILCGLFLLLFPNFLSKKVMEEKSSSSTSEKPVEVTVSRIETYKLTDTSLHTESLQSLGVKNPDYDLTKEEIIQKQIGGENLYEYLFETEDAALEDHGEEIHVVIRGQWVGNIGRNNRERVRRLVQDDSAKQCKGKITGGPHRILSAEDGEIHDYPDDYTVRLEITIPPSKSEGKE